MHPRMPKTVIKKRALYLKMLRAVTLLRNVIFFQSGPMCSSRMRLPAFGALGRIKAAGVCRRSRLQAITVAPTMATTNSATPPKA